MKRAFLVFVILAGLAVAGAAIAAVAQVGVPAPDFSLRDLNGRKVSLSDYAYQGPEKKGRPKKVVLLDFFRTDCGPCKKELPLVEQVYRKYRDKGFEVMLVTILEEKEGEKSLRQFFSRYTPPFPIIVDTYQAVAKRYITDGSMLMLPSMVLIDREGTVLKVMKGYDPAIDATLAPYFAPPTGKIAEDQ